MAREKSKDIRLFKITGRVTDTRSVTMAYVIYEFETVRTNSELTLTSTMIPIIKNTPEGEPIIEDYITSPVGATAASMFKKDNRLTCHVDFVAKTIRFPHLNRYKISKNFRGYGLSTYAMNEIATILKSQYSDYVIEPVQFSFSKEDEDVDRGAFFAFMEKFGFWFSFDGADNDKGILNIERAEMLKLALKKETLQELEIAPFIKSLFADRSKLQEEINRIKAEFKERSTVLNRFEKDQAITFLMNVVGVLILLILVLIFF